MHKAAHSSLPAPWALIVIDYGDLSPLAGHKSGEVAVDDEAQAFYVHAPFVAAYGLDSIERACQKYIRASK